MKYRLTVADSCERSVDRRSAVVSVIVIGAVGSIVFILLPLLIGAFTDRLALTREQVGVLGSADMTGMFVAALLATAWIRSLNWRLVALLAAALLALCHLLSAQVTDFSALLVVRTIAGFAGGSLMSIALTSLGDTRNPDRCFGLFIAAQLSIGALGLWVMPRLIQGFGLPGVFYALALIVASTALLIPRIPQQGHPVTARSAGPIVRRSMMPGFWALLACLAFNFGIMAVWAYMERIGNAAGLEAAYIGATLAGSLLAGLFGALLAAAIKDRLGRALPIAAALVVQGVALFLLFGTASRSGFAVAVMLFAFAWNFPVPFQLGITVSVDRSGRLVVLFLSAVKLGYAIAPATAAQLLVAGGGFRPVLLLGAAGFVASAAIFLSLAAPRVRRGVEDSKPATHPTASMEDP